jgi:hypothetical protein
MGGANQDERREHGLSRSFIATTVAGRSINPVPRMARAPPLLNRSVISWPWAKMELWKLRKKGKIRLAGPYRIPSPAWPYSSAAMKSTTFDSDCICLTSFPTSSCGSLVLEKRMR